jgi:Xaa-Pro aminopeptidase
MLQLGVSKQEYRNRISAVLAAMKEKGLDALVLWNGTSVFYLAGFAFISTERPMCLILGKDGKRTMFVPRLEVEHAGEAPEVDSVIHYLEYPTEKHPMKVLAEKMEGMGLGKANLGADGEGYGSPQGYTGPRLSEVLPDVKVTVIRDLVEKMRMVKSQEEIGLIRESARWGNLAHVLLQEYSLPGKTENEVSMRASLEATTMMIRTLGKSYAAQSSGRSGASASFRGQIGTNSALPHAITVNAVLKKGDVLVTGAGASVAGYGSELERTMFVQEVSDEKKRFFDHMTATQEIAFEAIRPGRKCSDVDNAVRAYFDKHNLWEHWRHHTGHALGLLGHEAPFFDTGDHTVIQSGMVFSVEPGLYVPGLGGFRHSDTVAVTETGIEFLTYYPRALNDLITGQTS